MRAALESLGLTFFCEEYVAPQIASGALVRVLEEWCPPFAGFFLYYPSRRQRLTYSAPLLLRRRTQTSKRGGVAVLDAAPI